ncbi:MAG: TetR/AcrR family transcriptional regulator [Peptococcaceae bacterium]|nr:TetR/AcrR family transcriptional regulator [Peptococcaceae bacterium]
MNKQEAKAAQTKAALVDAFWQLYTTKPIEKISVKDITDLTGVYRSTLYYYFADIYAILEYIEENILQDWEALIAETFSRHQKTLLSGNIVALASLAVPFYEKHGEHIAVLLSHSGDPLFQQKIKDTLRSKLFSMLQISTSNTDAQIVFEACSSGLLAVFVKVYNEKLPLEYVAQVIQKIINPKLFKTMLSYSTNPVLKLL